VTLPTLTEPRTVTNARSPRTHLLSNLLGVVILGVLGYAAFRFFWFDARPGDRVPLHGTSWTVIQVGSTAATGPITLSFDTGRDFGQVTSECFAFAFEYSRDTDGDGIGFFDFERVGASCSGDQATEADRLESVFGQVVVWRAPETDRIEFLDSEGPVVVAVRARTGDA
jgi:hypothetical protein